MVDVAYDAMMLGSLSITYSLMRSSVNIWKKRYPCEANNASMSSSALHQTCISSANCCVHGGAVLVTSPSTMGGWSPASASPFICPKAAAMGSTLSCGCRAIDRYMRILRTVRMVLRSGMSQYLRTASLGTCDATSYCSVSEFHTSVTALLPMALRRILVTAFWST